MNIWLELIILLITVLFVAYGYFKFKLSYWKRRGIFSVPGKIPCGSLTDFILSKKSISEVYADIYNKGQGHKYVGCYSFVSPTLLIRDLDIVKCVFVKDFPNFRERGIYYNKKEDPLAAHIFALNWSKCKPVRSKLGSAFSVGKIKLVYETMKVCTDQLKEYLIELSDKNDVSIDFKYVLSKNAINLIAKTAVGIENHSIKDDSKLSEVAFKVTDSNIIQAFRFILPMISKDIARLFRLRFTPKEVETFYLDMTKQIVEYRLKNDIKRNDFMHLLMEMWDKKMDLPEIKDDTNTLSLKDIAAHTFLFFLAAYESSASTMCFCLYELALNNDIQEKLIQEIDSVADDDISYEKLNDLKYLDMVLNEVWRKYPPGGMLFRECYLDYKLNDGNVIEKGTTVVIPVLGIHRDPELYPDPEKFDPERFNKESPSHEVKPFSFLPFGEGPRYCIGKLYGVIQAKLSLYAIMSQFRIEKSEKTVIPPIFDPKVFVLHASHGMYLRAINRKQ